MAESLRQRKRERTREALVAAGLGLFVEHGFDAVTVADIAARADVAPRTFHRYFPDKAELVFAGDAELRQAVLSALDAAEPAAGTADSMLAVLEAASRPLAGRHTELVARERLLRQVPALRARDLAKRSALEQLMAEHVAHRLGVSVDHDVRPRWWAGVAFATFTAGFQAWLTQGGTLSEHLQSATRLFAEEGTALPHEESPI